MTQAFPAQRSADDGFVFPISAGAADEIAHPPGCLELAAVDAETDAREVAVQGRASRMRQAAMRAASRTA